MTTFLLVGAVIALILVIIATAFAVVGDGRHHLLPPLHSYADGDGGISGPSVSSLHNYRDLRQGTTWVPPLR